MTVLPQGGMHPPTQQFHRWDLRSPLPRMGTENCCMFVPPQVVVLFPFLLLDLQLFLISCFCSQLITYQWNPVAVSSQKMKRKHPVKSLCSRRYFQHTHAIEWFCPPLEGPEEASLFPRQWDPAGSPTFPWNKSMNLGLRLNPTAAENHICLDRKLEYCMWNWWLCGLLKVGHILKLVEKFSSSIKEANLLEARPTPEKAKGWLNPRPEKKNVGIRWTYRCSFAKIATCL